MQAEHSNSAVCCHSMRSSLVAGWPSPHCHCHTTQPYVLTHHACPCPCRCCRLTPAACCCAPSRADGSKPGVGQVCWAHGAQSHSRPPQGSCPHGPHLLENLAGSQDAGVSVTVGGTHSFFQSASHLFSKRCPTPPTATAATAAGPGHDDLQPAERGCVTHTHHT